MALPMAPAAMADAAGVGGDYVPLTSDTRVLNTASGVGAPKGPKGPGTTTSFQVTGVGSVPTTNVRAVLVDIAAQGPTANTFLTIWNKDAAARPIVGSLNVTTGEQISATAIVEVGSSGQLSVFNNAGNTDIFVDVMGYFTTVKTATGPGGFVPVVGNPTVVNVTGIAANGSKVVNMGGGVVPAGSPAVFVDLQAGAAQKAGWIGTVPGGGTVQTSSLEFQPGTTSSGAVVRVGSDGSVTVNNHSTGTVNVLVRLLGYFTSSNSTGAGARPLARRLIDTTLPANGSVDVAVGGTNGLPTKNIAGAALFFTANSPTESGYFKAWGVGNTEPGSSVSTWPADKQRGGMAIIKPGTDGKIRVKSVSTGTVRLTVDLQAWFADPIAPLPIAQFTPVSVAQGGAAAGSSLGSLEYAYVDNIGVPRLGHQADPDQITVQWSPAATDGSYTGQPGISTYTDGRTQVTVQRTSGDYWAASQTAVGAATYNAWGNLGGTMASPPTQITLATGTTINLAVDSDGALWHHRIVTGTTSYWRNLGDQDLVGPVTAVPVAQGQQLFARDTSGAVRTVLYANDGTMGAWVNLGGNGVTDRPAVVAYPGPRLRVFARAGDGSVQTKIQNIDGTWPEDWAQVGSQIAAGAPAAILDPVLGRTAVVVRGADNEVYTVFETAAGSGTWGQWKLISTDGNSDPAASDPTIAPIRKGSGQTFLIAFRNPNDTTRVYYRQDQVALAKARTAATPAFTGYSLPKPPAGR
ncbi:hypothetical protein [Actinoplanes sp. NPDC049265]|uniref:hypothetical protein n=1 Tax=Actinoplanes sp. NPDC049265 TaxID=3363902 RepID=UPI0037131652